MKQRNRPHEVPVRTFLETLVNSPADHARFMNMLSMLEHMGSRKIMLSQMNKTLTEDCLKHLAEEARHAYFFKRQAERIAGQPLDGYTEENTMCRVPALMYFGRLDAGITDRIYKTVYSPRKRGSVDTEKDPRFHGESKDWDTENLCYPWVSLIIELRACWLYHIYHEVLDGSAVKLSLKSLLAEEDMHLAEMFEMVGENHERIQKLSAYETQLFEKLWAQLQTTIALPQAA